MKTQARSVSRRLVSLALVLLMAVSMAVVGGVSASAADTELAQTGWTGSETFRLLSSATSWNKNDAAVMTSHGASYYWSYGVTNVSTSSNMYFRVYDATNNQVFCASSNDKLIKPAYVTDYTEGGSWVTNSDYGNVWQIDMSTFASLGTTVTVYISYYATYNGSANQIKVYVSDAAGATPSTNSATIHFNTAEHSVLATNPNIYVWEASTATAIGSGWPGLSCTTTDTNGFYSHTFNYATDYKFIICNNDGSTKTADSDAYTGDIWVVLNSDLTYTVTDYDPSVPATTVTYKLYMSGDGGATFTDPVDISSDTAVPLTASAYCFYIEEYTDEVLSATYKNTASTSASPYSDDIASLALSSSGTENVYFTATDDSNYYFSFDGTELSVVSVATLKLSPTAAPFWVDTCPSFLGSTIAMLYPEVSSSTYTLYLPAGVDMTAVPFYFSGASLTIDGNNVANGGEVALSDGGTYSLGGAITGTLKVYKSADVASLYSTTGINIPTTTGFGASKDDYSSKGTYMKADSTGAVELSEGDISKIKGRGNSSWESANGYFGKYSFNITTGSKATLIADGIKCKKYSLLANNADESRMRNMLVYDLSHNIGIDYTADFEPMDFYNNNKYMGSYLLTYKVEIGNPLVDIYDLEGANEDLVEGANAEIFADNYTRGYSGGSSINETTTPGFYKYIDNMTTPEVYQGGYLLEFELNERYAPELCGFISTEGQQIVCKYPELASQTEVEYIRSVWNTAEAVMYDPTATYAQLSQYIDVESFAKMYLIQELTKNLDTAATSYYVYLDLGGKLTAGCAWDYDWTLGQYTNDRSEMIGSTVFGTGSAPCGGSTSGAISDATGWWANSKEIYGRSNLNAQAALCQNSNFWNVVEAEWNEVFYDTATEYCPTANATTPTNLTGTIATYYNTLNDSIEMDETRWGFIASDKISSWGSTDTGDTYDSCVVWLNNWYNTRLNWMNTYLNADDYTLNAPTLTADKDSFQLGDTVTLTAGCTSAGNLLYTFYNDSDVAVGTVTSATGTAELSVSAPRVGTCGYYVKVSSENTTSNPASEEISLTVTNISFSVSLAPGANIVEAGNNIVLTAICESVESVTYKLYDSQNTLIDENTTGIFNVATDGTDGGTTKTYYVTADTSILGTDYTATSSNVSVSVTTVAEYYVVNIFFKSTSSYGYSPVLTTTGAISDVESLAMTRTTLIGQNATQTASYYWYRATINVARTASSIEMIVKSNRYHMVATASVNFTATGDYYFGCDNLNYGTKLVNLTNASVAERDWFQSAVHMVYDAAHDGELASSGAVRTLASIGDANGDGEVNIKDTTFVQKALVRTTQMTASQAALCDLDGDGYITIKDATAIQRRVALL